MSPGQNEIEQMKKLGLDKPLFEQKCSVLFEHVYESYHGEGAGLYAGAA